MGACVPARTPLFVQYCQHPFNVLYHRLLCHQHAFGRCTSTTFASALSLQTNSPTLSAILTLPLNAEILQTSRHMT